MSTNLEVVKHTLLIAPEVQIGAGKLDSVLGINHQTTAQALGMTEWSPTDFFSRSNRLRSREGDAVAQSHFIHIDPHDSAALADLKSLRPGSILNLSSRSGNEDLSSMPSDDFLDFTTKFNQRKTIAIVIRNTDQGTLLYGYVRKPRPDEKGQGNWGDISLGSGNFQSEEYVARALLADFFGRDKRNEATAAMTTVFRAIGGGNGLDSHLTTEGCQSHESPVPTIAKNFKNGKLAARTIAITDQGIYLNEKLSENHWIVEAKITDDGHIAPLAEVKDVTVDESLLFFYGLSTQAVNIAEKSNPTHMGGGTRPEDIVDAIAKTVYVMPEIVGNDGTVGEVVGVFKKNMKVQ